jgi:hypothetical protein
MAEKVEAPDLSIIECPHCKQTIEITEINCGIFRHGVYKETGEQIDPHMPKEGCHELVIKDLIYGCGRPFRIVESINSQIVVEICEYI